VLKNRLIGVIIIRKGIVVQSIGFNKYLPIGVPDIAVEFLNKWGIDEIIALNIDNSKYGEEKNFELVSSISKQINVPLTYGGGINEVKDIEKIIHAGADKISLNSNIFKNFELISEGAKYFGSQSIIVSIDAKNTGKGNYSSFSNSGSVDQNISPENLAIKAQDYGAGEILINSIDRDGAKNGYDLNLIDNILKVVDIPVIVCGGVGHPEHFRQGLKIGATAVAAANFFNYFEHSVIVSKYFLKINNENIRLDSYTDYQNSSFDNLGRIARIDDEKLEKLRFEYIPEEKI
jgi:cyclase